MFVVTSQDIVYRVMRAMVTEGHHKNSCMQRQSALEEHMLSRQAARAPVRQGASQLEWQRPVAAEARS